MSISAAAAFPNIQLMVSNKSQNTGPASAGVAPSLREARNAQYASNWSAISLKPTSPQRPQARLKMAQVRSSPPKPLQSGNRPALPTRGSQNLPAGMSDVSAGTKTSKSTSPNYPAGLDGMNSKSGGSSSKGGFNKNAGYGKNGGGNNPWR
jgi:hypothetical protein